MSGSGRVGRALCSAAVCILSSYAVAALSAVAFRFPIPFGGYASGLDAARLTPLAVTFYGLLGGFVLQGALGVGATACVCRRPRRGWCAWPACLWAAVVASVPGVLLLATLDWFIGPW